MSQNKPGITPESIDNFPNQPASNATSSTNNEQLEEAEKRIEKLEKENQELRRSLNKQIPTTNSTSSILSYQRLLAHMRSAFAFYKIIVDSNNEPIDFTYLEVNTAFEKLTGLVAKEVIGKSFFEIHPNLAEDNINWLQLYGKVALSNQKINLDQVYSTTLKKWYNISAYSPKPGYFATIFRNKVVYCAINI